MIEPKPIILDRDWFEIGEPVTVGIVKELPGKDHAPPLKIGEEHIIRDIFVEEVDDQKFQHIDLGIKCELNFVTSYETGRELPNSDKIHWVHPSRLIKILK